MLGTYSMKKKGFTFLSLLSFTKKLGRYSYDVTITYYDDILKLSLFRFVANVQDLQWDNFFVLTINRRGFIFPAGKNDAPGLHRPRITQA